MKQFDLSVWLKDKSQKICTRDGRPVRIVCTDRKGKSGNIVGLVGENEASIYVWNNNGKHIVSGDLGNNLVFAEEEDDFSELRESEDERIRKALVEWFYGNIKSGIVYGLGFSNEEIIAWLEKQGEKVLDIRYSILDKLIEADDIYQMSVNDAMIGEARNKAISALSKLEVYKSLELEKKSEQKPASKDLEEYAKKLAKGAALDKHNLIWMCKKGAEWQKQKDMQDFLEKACEWLEDTQLENFICRDDGIYFENEKFVEQFKKYMQDEI